MHLVRSRKRPDVAQRVSQSSPAAVLCASGRLEYIQSYNSTLPADSGWATDPQGLVGALQNLARPAGVDWVAFVNPSRDWVMFETLFWMNIEKYPSPVLVNQGGHWVVIVGWTTDVEPVSGSSPVLQSIHFHDPEPHNVGTDTNMTGAQWYAGPWNGPVMYAGSWLNDYVAVVEPPTSEGAVSVKQIKRTGTKLLSPEEALEKAHGIIEERKLAEHPQYALLAREDVAASTPMLVREELADSKAGTFRITTSWDMACAERPRNAATG
jgi:hypothetical protein